MNDYFISLLDNSQGTTNENAAGADRLQFEVALSKYTLTTTTDTDFVELVRVNKGLIELKVDKPIYNEIEHTMARRTFDANGDFVVRQFVPNLKEHLDTSTNGGVYTKANGGDESKLVMQVSPGKAYVKGYEIEKIGTTTVPLNKARSVVSLDNANTPVRLGNKLRVTSTVACADLLVDHLALCGTSTPSFRGLVDPLFCERLENFG